MAAGLSLLLSRLLSAEAPRTVGARQVIIITVRYDGNAVAKTRRGRQAAPGVITALKSHHCDTGLGVCFFLSSCTESSAVKAFAAVR